jgi:Na+-transporting NADH:ubiquinone oxidoreductase subunit C
MPEVPRQQKAGRESVRRTLLVALLVSLVCSSLVASAAVVLRPRQEANALLDQRRNILEVAGKLEANREVDELFEAIEPRVLSLQSGELRDDVDPATVDPLAATRDPELSVAIPPELDVARLGRRPKEVVIYVVRDQGDISRIILPVSGYGLWSTMYGFLALQPDGNTVADIVFYSHAETAGIGDFVGKPAWQSRWSGKKVYDDEGELRLRVVKGRVSPDEPGAEYQVDGVSGATLTGNGVTNLIAYWLGDHGYGPFLRRIREGGGG